MPAHKGHKKAGGRQPGTPNKVTTATREAFQLLVDRNFDKLEDWIIQTAQDDPHKAFGMVMDLASFCIPRLKAIDVTTNGKEVMTSLHITREVISK